MLISTIYFYYSYVTLFLLFLPLLLNVEASLTEPHVIMVRNTLSYRFLAMSESTIQSTYTQNSASNLIMEDSGSSRYLRKYSDASQKVQWVPTVGCEQGMTISSSSMNFIVSPPGDSTGVTLHVLDTSGKKYYLRVNVLTKQVTLECEQAYENASALKIREFEHDLLTIPTALIT